MSVNAAVLRRIDAIADQTFAGWHAPGLVYGVVLGGELIHARGLGTLRIGEKARPDVRPQSLTSFHLAWWLSGERGRVRVEILLSPELPPRIQTLALTSVPEPPPVLHRIAARLVELVHAPSGGPVSIDWPANITVSDAVDIGAVVRALRATEARFTPLELGPVVDGDGERTATFRLHGRGGGRVDLALAIDPAKGCLGSVSLVPLRLSPPQLD